MGGDGTDGRGGRGEGAREETIGEQLSQRGMQSTALFFEQWREGERESECQREERERREGRAGDV